MPEQTDTPSQPSPTFGDNSGYACSIVVNLKNTEDDTLVAVTGTITAENAKQLPSAIDRLANDLKGRVLAAGFIPRRTGPDG